MRVIVCGAGQVGYSIARHLAAENVDVMVIDQSEELTQRISDQLEVRAITGYASHPDVLERAGAAEADMMIAVTFADEVNMIACQVAHALFNIPTKIARIRAQSYLKAEWGGLFNRENLPIDHVISPEIEVARAIGRRLEMFGAFDMIPFAEDRIRVVGVRLPANCPVVDTPLRQLNALFPDLHITIMGILRGDTAISPTSDDQLTIGDEVYFAADRGHIERAIVAFGFEPEQTRRVVVLGGGNIGLFLARELEASRKSVRVSMIETRRARAEQLAEMLGETVVIAGDALDRDILVEANAREAEAVIAVTNDDSVNVLASLLCKREGTHRAIALVNNPSYGSLVGPLGIDATVSPRSTTVSSILQHIRRGRIRKVYTIRDGLAEIVEAEALETSPLVGRPLRDVVLPDGLVIGAIARGKTILMARGDTVIQKGDRVVLFALADAVKQVEKLFAVRLEFF
jgi:trk system potassium uptake protein TrkA